MSDETLPGDSSLDTLAGTPATEDTLAGLPATADTLASDGLAAPARTQPTRRRSDRAQGELIGRYVILGKLGAGGMGVVYAAYDPELDRKVAVKLLLGHADAASASLGRARLVREAQALAKLSHPHVVAIHDVGEDAGEVWIAMEFVEGQTLSEWLAAAPRDWRAVLAVIRAAGEGLVAAHQKGLLHRDIKPDNIMVGADGRVRVMDFGLARGEQAAAIQDVAVDAQTAEGAPLGPLGVSVTRAGSILGTPAYMAPEQLRGGELTAAVDQFALCVTAWEALHGERPFAGETLLELAAKVLAEQVQPAKNPAVPAWLTAVLRQGLRAEPSKRHRDVQALLDALTRGGDRAQRKKLGLAAGLVVGVIGAGAGGAVGYERHETAQQTQACVEQGAAIDADWNDAARAKLRAGLLATEVSYAESTVEKVLPYFDAQASAWREAATQACMDTRVHGTWTEDLLDRASWCLDERRMELVALAEELGKADREIIQKAILSAASMGPIAPCLDAERLRRSPLPPDDREAIRAVRRQLSTVGALGLAGRYADGLDLAQAALADARVVGWEPLLAAATLSVGKTLAATGDYAAAEPLVEDAYFLAANADDELVIDAATELVSIVGARLARGPEGLRWGRWADLELLASGEPDDGLRRAAWFNALGAVHNAVQQYDQAKAQYERALAIRERRLGPDHPQVAVVLANLGNAYMQLGDYDQAKAHQERALRIREQALGADHPDIGGSLNNIGVTYLRRGEFPQAKATLERALQIRDEALGSEHPLVGDSLSDLAVVHASSGEFELAKPLLERSLAIREKSLGPDHPKVADLLTNLGLVYANLAEYEQAKAAHTRALAIFETALGPESVGVGRALNNLGNLYRQVGDYQAAKASYERSAAIKEKLLGPDHPEVGGAWMNLGHVCLSLDQPDAAKDYLERAAPILEKALGPDHPDLGNSLTALASAHEGLGDDTQAKPLHERALAIADKAFGPEHPSVVAPLLGLARIARRAGGAAEAVTLAERAVSVQALAKLDAAASAEARFELARGLWDAPADAGRDRVRARALAEQARDGYGDETTHAQARREVEAWLSKHRL